MDEIKRWTIKYQKKYDLYSKKMKQFCGYVCSKSAVFSINSCWFVFYNTIIYPNICAIVDSSII
jgi:hypothetical protein